jgi:hypothetical protein
MKKFILVLLLVSLIGQVTDAQLLRLGEYTNTSLWKLRRYELAAGVGPSFFFGDVGGYSPSKNLLGLRDLSLLQTRFNINGNLKYRVYQRFNLRLSLTFGNLFATDKRGSNEARDLQASVLIFEPALIGEYYFVKNKAESSYFFMKGTDREFKGFFRSLDFYIFGGIGGVSYSISGNDNLIARGLVPKGFAAVIPGGFGTTLIYNPNINFGLELGARYALSDNIDGYSSQYSHSNDVYMFLNFTVTYKLKNGPNWLPSFR